MEISGTGTGFDHSTSVSFGKYNLNSASALDVCLSVHRRICVEKKNQLDATEWFIALIICSTCFGHFYAHHQEFEIMFVLLPPIVCSAMVTGCRGSGAEQQAVRPEREMLHDLLASTHLFVCHQHYIILAN